MFSKRQGPRMEQYTENDSRGGQLLVIDNVSVQFGGVVAVDGVSLTVEEGTATGVIGPNGAGKSSLLGAIAGAERCSTGKLEFLGRDVTRLPMHRRCRMGISRTFQTPRPMEDLTVRETVEVASEFGATGRRPLSAHECLELCGLSAVAGAPVLSLGPSYLRRLELARALATGPRLLMVDEVAAGVPTPEQESLVEILSQIGDLDITLLMIEHVLPVVTAVVSRLIVLDRGSVIADGPPRDVLALRHVEEAYLGTGSLTSWKATSQGKQHGSYGGKS